MRRAALLAALCVSLGACDKGRALAVTSCALSDGKLSVAFRNPGKAKAYLLRLGERLKEREDAAILEAVDLVERVARCTE